MRTCKSQDKCEFSIKPVLRNNYNFHCGNGKCNHLFEIDIEDLECGACPDDYCESCGTKINWQEYEDLEE
jgi:hypothetical protein